MNDLLSKIEPPRGSGVRVVVNRTITKDGDGRTLKNVPRPYQLQVWAFGIGFYSVWFFGDDEESFTRARAVAGCFPHEIEIEVK